MLFQRRTILAALAVNGLLSALPALAAGADRPPPTNRQPDRIGGYSSSQMLLRLKPAAITTAFRQREALFQNNFDPRSYLSPRFRAATMRWKATRMRPAYVLPFSRPDLAAQYGLDRTFILEAPQGTDMPAMTAEIAALRDIVEAATVDTISGTAGDAPVYPNDPQFDLQYGLDNYGQIVGQCFGGSSAGSLCTDDLNCPGGFCDGASGIADADIDAPEAWAIHTGDIGSVIVAIIDSGIYAHVEFSGRMVTGRNTNNPFTPTLTTDVYGHGTAVAGAVGAKGNNAVGFAGVSWGVHLMPIRVLDNGGGGTSSQTAAGIVWAADNGADIGNLSLQFYALPQEELDNLQAAVNYAHGQGMLLIAAAGNGGANVVASPARLENCMAVSATQQSDAFAEPLSNYGEQVDVCAAGIDVRTTAVGNNYTTRDGTSFATPHVTGVAALVKSYVPGLTLDEIVDILIASADDLGPVGWDQRFGHGRVNAHQALLLAATWRGIRSSVPPDGAIDARQPHELDGSNPQGWDEIELTFDAAPSALDSGDFDVSQVGGALPPPAISDLELVEPNKLRVVFDRPIEVGAWTVITHSASGTSVRIGYLPGDVNGDGVSAPADILDLIDALNGVGPPREIWSTDINRSDVAEPSDILSVIDLLNGAQEFDAFLDAALP